MLRKKGESELSKEHEARVQIFTDELEYLALFAKKHLGIEPSLVLDPDLDFVYAYLGYCLSMYWKERQDWGPIKDQALNDLQVMTRARGKALAAIWKAPSGLRVVHSLPVVAPKDKLEKMNLD